MQFEAFPKIPRFANEQVVITEKVDGTNAAVVIEVDTDGEEVANTFRAVLNGVQYRVGFQSRKRLVVPDAIGGKGADNFGFAAWGVANLVDLVFLLGEGRHYGEWMGVGIQRGYGLRERRFLLFNTRRFGFLSGAIPEAAEEDVRRMRDAFEVASRIGVGVVPVLYEGFFNTEAIQRTARELREIGSHIATNTPAEGYIIYLKASGALYKVPFDIERKGPKDKDGNAIPKQLPLSGV